MNNQNYQKTPQAWDTQTYRMTNAENEPQISRTITNTSQFKSKLSNELQSSLWQRKPQQTLSQLAVKEAKLSLNSNPKYKAIIRCLHCCLTLLPVIWGWGE